MLCSRNLVEHARMQHSLCDAFLLVLCSRYLANKCSIASRIDCFMDQATDAFGQKLREQVGPWCGHAVFVYCKGLAAGLGFRAATFLCKVSEGACLAGRGHSLFSWTLMQSCALTGVGC